MLNYNPIFTLSLIFVWFDQNSHELWNVEDFLC